ncbi:uncharacterized protein PV09_01235 [Verruconis gallopava]|uniref:Cytochrome P450 n=1 Tax=Verruconis gallopava TaxID=253628 RepID=A0A0D1XZT0_9PEZI|nr:uncharacterized protein PV09_01235 [Verruconis gallopava]KIW08316.1 hypothetical protein PV09_01235 [Verruconis gallopava]
MGVGKLIYTIVFACIAYPTYSIVQHYRIAKRVGLPVLVTPVNPFSPVWWFLGSLLFPLMRRVPLQIIQDWAMFGDIGWPFGDRGQVHKRYGPTFLIVTPGGSNLVTSDPKTIEECLRRTNAFLKPPVIYSAIEYFGPNVDTVNGDAWQRHRRLTTPPFNERNSGLVWKESLKQAEGMAAEWSSKTSVGGDRTLEDTKKLALHVLTSAGFGKNYDFEIGTTKVPEGHSLSYRDALAGILKDMLVSIIAANVNAPLWMLPKSWRDMKQYQAEFKKYMIEMADEQRASMKDEMGAPQQDNLMAALIRANEVSRSQGKGRYSLSDEEIYGNLFIWNLAGHDTTAGTLAFAFTLLSVRPDVQDWIAEEINAVFGDTTVDKWDYEKSFPRLRRCLATMYETLRLFGPVPSMTKQTFSPQSLEIAGEQFQIPENYMLTLNLTSLHYSESHWGSDSHRWRPSRFIKEGELVIPGPGNTFIPWVAGPRVCPGKKFAQVEFVATLAMCLRKHRVQAVPEAGESEADTYKRVFAVANYSEMGVNPTLKMVHPERVRLSWKPTNA